MSSCCCCCCCCHHRRYRRRLNFHHLPPERHQGQGELQAQGNGEGPEENDELGKRDAKRLKVVKKVNDPKSHQSGLAVPGSWRGSNC